MDAIDITLRLACAAAILLQHQQPVRAVTFAGMFVSDSFALFMKLLVLLGSLVATLFEGWFGPSSYLLDPFLGIWPGPIYDEALSIDRQNVMANLRLAELLDRGGREKEAFEYWGGLVTMLSLLPHGGPDVDRVLKVARERADVTLPVRPGPLAEGRIHPVSQVFDEVAEIFVRVGDGHIRAAEHHVGRADAVERDSHWAFRRPVGDVHGRGEEREHDVPVGGVGAEGLLRGRSKESILSALLIFGLDPHVKDFAEGRIGHGDKFAPAAVG